jgi:hypothetical protein
MTLANQNLSVNSAGTQPETQTIYKIGGGAALFIILLGLLDIFIMFVPGTSVDPGTLSALDWFKQFEASWFIGLRNLGLFNMLTNTAMILIIFAFYIAHRQKYPSIAALALIFVCMGAAIYIANNTSLPMLALSRQYASASDETQKSLLVASARALLVREDLTAGAFAGFLFTEIACIITAILMLKGKIFNRSTAVIGLIGEGSLLIFNFWAAFIPQFYNFVLLVFGAGGGLVTLVWLSLVARRFFQLK